LPVGTVSTFTSTRLMEYLQLVFSNAFTWPIDKYLLNHVDLKIKLRRSRDAFALVADAANNKIKIKEMVLYVRKVQLSPGVRMGHVKALEKTSCKSKLIL
jgi:hypothetical protein